MNPHAAAIPALSQRASHLRPSSTLAVSARVRELQAQGKDVIGFGTGEPDFDTPLNITDMAIEALRGGKTKYVSTPGAYDARAAIAAKLQAENGIECTPEHVVITNGAKQALFQALQVLVGSGDQVILPTPCWVSYAPMVELAGGEVVEVAGRVDNNFKISPEQLARAVTARTRAIVINSPSNPCGMMYRENELRALAATLEGASQNIGREIFIITDEIYEKLIFGDVAHFSMGSIPAIADRVITINGLSKAFAMTGWRIGYLCAPGFDGRIARTISMMQDQMTGCITSFTYSAIVEAITNTADTVEMMQQTYAKRAVLMYGELNSIPGFNCTRPTGAFYIFPDIRSFFGRTSPGGRVIKSAVSFTEALLDDAGVAVVPGDDFGECAKPHVRLSFACSEEAILEGTRRIREWVGHLT